MKKPEMKTLHCSKQTFYRRKFMRLIAIQCDFPKTRISRSSKSTWLVKDVSQLHWSLRYMAYYNNRPGHHTWNVSSVTYWNPIDMVFSEQVYIIKWWSKNQVSENSVKYSWNYEALSVSLKCPINHEIKKIKISCFGNTKILTLTCFDPNMKKIKTREQG